MKTNQNLKIYFYEILVQNGYSRPKYIQAPSSEVAVLNYFGNSTVDPYISTTTYDKEDTKLVYYTVGMKINGISIGSFDSVMVTELSEEDFYKQKEFNEGLFEF